LYAIVNDLWNREAHVDLKKKRSKTLGLATLRDGTSIYKNTLIFFYTEHLGGHNLHCKKYAGMPSETIY
jgi:hypothetical protein